MFLALLSALIDETGAVLCMASLRGVKQVKQGLPRGRVVLVLL